jgi:hypothetical protein
MIRLFFCPECGRALKMRPRDPNFYKKSPSEEGALSEQLKDIRTIADALRKFGKPDYELGRKTWDFYPCGKRVRQGIRRALFYEHLAETITVSVIHWLDGVVESKLYEKQRPRTGVGP